MLPKYFHDDFIPRPRRETNSCTKFLASRQLLRS